MILDLDHRLGLVEQILCLLREHPERLSEYQLIQLLKARYSTRIPHHKLADRLVLFRTHFFLFNVLYRLRGHLWAKHKAHLEISPLSPRLHPHVSGTQMLEQDNPLHGCHLDLCHLGKISETDVERLLQSFWTRTQDSKEEAAAPALFELEGVINYPTIRLRYR